MKNLKLIIFSALFLTILAFMSENKDQVTVQKINGVPVYIMCEPEHPYQVVDQFSSDGLIVIMNCPDIDKTVEYYVDRAIKEKISFDAILYTKGKKAQAIKFK